MAEKKSGRLRVLNLEDNPNDSELNQAELETGWDEVEWLRVETRDAFVRALDEFAPDIVLSDFNLPDMNGREALRIVRESHPGIPVVMVSGALGEIEAVELVKLGARDYVMKDHLQRLSSAVQGALSLERGIRARKAAELALRQREEEIRELVERSPVAMIVDVGSGADESVVMMNRRFTELFG
jgi:DNA-binding response OmpR family regulator